MIGLRIVADDAKPLAALTRSRTKIRFAISNGLKQGGNLVRTQVRRAMLEQTSLKQLKSVVSRSSTIYPSPIGALEYAIIFRGTPTKPAEFAFKVATGRGGGVTIRMWGKDHRLKRSFQIAGQSGAFGLRARLGTPRLPIQSFDGPNLAKEAGKDKTAETFLMQSHLLIPPIIEKYLAKAVY